MKRYAHWLIVLVLAAGNIYFAKEVVEKKAHAETTPPFRVIAVNPEDGCKLTQWVGGYRVVYVTCPGVGQVPAAKY